MIKKLDELREKKFLEISSWAGLSSMPGTESIIVTKDKKIYYYHNYHHVPIYLKDKVKLEDISKGKVLDDKIYSKLVNYVENNIIGKDFEDIMIFDAGWRVSGNLNNNNFNICNHLDIYNDLRGIIGG